MGKATASAFAEVGKYDGMAGQILYRPPEGDKYLVKYVSSKGNGKHIEKDMIEVLTAQFGSLGNIPNGSTVIIAANCSPCRQCMNAMGGCVPKLLTDMNVASRSIKVKFRFRKYYTTAITQHTTAWLNSATADVAYQALAAKYGDHSFKSIGTQVSPGLVTVKKKVVFQSYVSDAKTSSTEDWSAMFN